MPKIHWTHGIDGSFFTAADWSTHTVPGANDDVFIDATGTYTVTVSATHTIRTLETASTATLAITAGKFTITNGTGTGTNAGTISVGNGAALAIGGAFNNSGRVALHSGIGIGIAVTDLIVTSNVNLTGGGEITLTGHSAIVGSTVPVRFPFPLPFPFRFPFPPVYTLTNSDNTIQGAGSIGAGLALINAGTILGNSSLVLTVNTGTHTIRNSGVMEGTTPEGLVIVSNVANSGTLEAVGEAARLVVDGTVINSGSGNVTASGSGAHVDLSSAAIRGGGLSIGESDIVQSVAESGSSFISGVGVTGSGTLQVNVASSLSITNSSVSTGITLASNGNDSFLSIDGTVGTNVATIAGGETEFQGPSAANVTFTGGQPGVLRLDTSFTGTVAGFAAGHPVTFTNFFAFGDSSLDSGALQYLGPLLVGNHLTDRLKNALLNGGTDSPVGPAVGQMNSQILAASFGLSANTAYTTNGDIGGGGTNYAISGAFNAANAANGNAGNSNSADPHFLSTVAQMGAYLNSVGGQADSSALYVISSGGNDISFANGLTDPQTYLSAQAQSLASEIELLYRDGARHIMVSNTTSPNVALGSFYAQQLFGDLDASGIAYIKNDANDMVQDVIADPTAYGFTNTTVHRGVMGTQTESALIQVDDQIHTFHGWGLWGADTTTQQQGVPVNQQYSYLSSSDAEQTHFFADDEHLSAAGQQIQANFERNLLVDDVIDLPSLIYMPGQTVASFSGTTASGLLTVSNGTGMPSAGITLLGNYMASTFVTAGDGTGGTLVMENPQPQLLLAAAHN